MQVCDRGDITTHTHVVVVNVFSVPLGALHVQMYSEGRETSDDVTWYLTFGLKGLGRISQLMMTMFI